MKKNIFLTLLVFLSYGMQLFSANDSGRPAKPNILLLLTDDLGWQDVKCYDIGKPSPMETPNLDALAKKGVMFWQAYSPAPVCAPSRAAILSGHHPVYGEMTSVAGGNPPNLGHRGSKKISPWYSTRMPIKTFTIAEALKAEGYTTGHSGKWHISKNHYAYPNPFDHGFDSSVHDRGVQSRMKPSRIEGFATEAKEDPYRLDKNGYPFDVPQDAAMTFIKENKDKPFFLYYATWLVHTPIVMRSEAVLRKYEKKLGVKITEEHKENWDMPGQTNPFYCAMVEQLDYYVGQVFNYLEETDDPRWPGHKLMENTYIIFTSDNGGMEGGPHTIITDNYPLDRGKISVKEGGVRVPLMITGPNIPVGVQTDVMVNGLDFYPTILSLIGAKKPAGKRFDGCDLVPLLTKDINDPSLVRDSKGNVRDTMFWHFPQMENSSSIRVGDYKLVRRYRQDTLELYHLYETEKGKAPVRVDIEEKKDLASSMPEKTADLNAQLSEMIESMGGRIPYYNPKYSKDIPGKDKVPKVLTCEQKGDVVNVSYQNNGAKVLYADLIYTTTGGTRDEEWLRLSAELVDGDKVTVTLPKETTHYFINLIDENNFWLSYPDVKNDPREKTKIPFSKQALSVNKK